MADETPTRSAGTPEGRGHYGGRGGEQSPLQARAAFFANRHWESVVGFNRGACARGGALHGINSETGGACAADWEESRRRELSLGEALDFLRSYHKRAPFLFFNGNTFAEIARQIALAIFAELPAVRRKEVASAIAHYIAGVLDRDAMVEIVEGLSQSASFQAGDRVKTLRGSLRGVVRRLLDDGRIVWRADGGTSELIALPESLMWDN